MFLGRSGTTVFSVQALLSIRRATPGPLFILSIGIPLTRAHLVCNLTAALHEAGLDDSAHSFCIGTATTAAEHALEDSLFHTLGRWRSDAYKLYIKLPRTKLASISQELPQGSAWHPQGSAWHPHVIPM